MPSEGTAEMKRRRASERASLCVLFQVARPTATAGNNQYPSRGNYSTEEKGSEENGSTGFTKLKRERACYFHRGSIIFYQFSYFLVLDFSWISQWMFRWEIDILIAYKKLKI